ncbi:MAG: hypothetical protein JNL10_14670 [Verrucomicrobiales bacterium]|nr:hypothetical protein [Verrucomicrobiales bacterium]
MHRYFISHEGQDTYLNMGYVPQLLSCPHCLSLLQGQDIHLNRNTGCVHN